MLTHILYKTNFYDSTYNEMANELYSDSGVGYVIIKNYIDKTKVENLQKIFDSYDYSDQYKAINNIKKAQKGNSFHYLAKYFYRDKPSQENMLNELIQQIFNERTKITLQPKSDLFMLDYCKRNSLDIENLEQIYKHLYSHSFTRLVKYHDGQGQGWHYDNPGEIQAILFLSKKGIDYKDGGLILENTDGTIVDVDAIVESGDLVLLNSYRKKHKVNPVYCDANQIGRMHLFVPMIPEYLFPKSYCFKSNKYKLFFQDSISQVERINFYIKHYYHLLFNKRINIIDSGIQHFHTIDENIQVGDYSLLTKLKSRTVYLAPLNTLTKTIFYNNQDFKFAGFIDNKSTSLRFEHIKFSKELEYDYVIVATAHQAVINQFEKNKILIMKNNKLVFYIDKSKSCE